ncbi:hypothetical protein ElyMa_000738900 [Elysia marginata]|uniref:Endonuclease/exonuclease/phosphatase domain-containing protein n=1 Tax=Elysia marginata TaxID=1093978 RepID=A0AAV4GS08_9GAST|nr:hypothetical protein ElyMa_000738900 [Elysia marginata]
MTCRKHLNKATLVALLLPVSSYLDLSSADTCRKLTTFNAALSPRNPDYAMRRKLQAFGLMYEDTDVLCLQETWLERDIIYTLFKLMGKLTYHFSPLHSSVNVLIDFKNEPRIQKFAEEKHDCFHCFITIVVVVLIIIIVIIIIIIIIIIVITNVINNINVFIIITTTTHYCHHAYSIVLIIFVVIKDFGTVVCSHFSPVLPLYLEHDDDLGFSDYKQQQLEMAVIHNKFASRDHVIVADFNTGPRVETANSLDKVLVGEVPDHYQVWLDNGYNTTYMTDDGRYTHCDDSNATDPRNNAVNFVMFKGDYTAGKEKRVLGCFPTPGDHYGVKRTVCKR